MKQHTNIFTAVVLTLALFAFAGCTHTCWRKGNLHTHSLWSDGKDYPETVVGWYKSNGYNFLALSDHNILSQGQKWTDVNEAAKEEVFRKYRERFGEKWVEQRTTDKGLQVRLKPIGEFRCLFEEPNRFLLVGAEEITSKKPSVHINAFNLREPVQPRDSNTVVETLQNDTNAVLTQSANSGQMMIFQINHPNWRWVLTAEDIMQIKAAKFFEVYNGHSKVHNDGDRYRAGTERMWDIILSKRLAELNLPIIYGTATDDAHNFHKYGPDLANPGRGWVMVRADYLTPESIIRAMDGGDFYATTGVVLEDIQFDGKTLKVEIKPEIGVSYTTRFIGTLKGCDLTSKPVIDANGVEIHTTQIYSGDIGRVLAEVKGTAAGYTCTGNEIYVRAKIISTKAKHNAATAGEVEVAWVQPVIPKSR